MGTAYTKTSPTNFVDGETIEATDFTTEFDAIDATFETGGHQHDGTDGEGGAIEKLLSNTITLGTGADTDIAVTFNANTADGVLTWMEDEDYFKFSDDVLVDSTEKLYFRDTAIYLNSSTDGQLDLVADTEIQIAATTVDLNGNLDVSGTLTQTGIATFAATPVFSADVTIEDDLYLDSDAAVIHLGEDGDVTLTHVADTGILLNSTMQLQFNDSSQYINAPSATILDINATDEIELNATLADVNANLDVSGTYTGGGLMTTGGNIVIPDAGNIGSASDTDAIAISSGGVVTMNQIPVFSAGINVSGGTIAGTLATAAQGNVTSLGTLTALTVDDVAVNGKVITMTGSSSDTAVFTAGTNGTLSIVTTDAAAAAANIQITADGTVDIDSAGVLTLDSGAAINIEPASGSAILLDGTISIDAGVVTGATSITSTAFVGDITGDVTGNASGTAATVTTAAQSSITSLGTLTTLTVDNVIINGTTIGHTDDTDLITLADGVVTVAGELDAATLDISGNADIDGTTNLDAVDIDGAVQIDATVTVGANDQGYDIIFYGDTASANMTWDTSADDLIFNGGAGLIVPDGQFTLGSTAVTTTAAEINLIDGGTSRGTTAVASGDGILINDAGTMRMTNVDTVSTYFSSHNVGGGNIVTTGALDTGSITSGFGAIDNGASNITTTGDISGGTVNATSDTAAGDNAAIGYTSAEGLILTGQGSSGDVTIKNDADAKVMEVLTGTTTAAFSGEVTGTGFTGTLDGILGSGTAAAATVTQLTSGGNIVSDTDSTDSLGSTGVRWAGTWTDAINGVTAPTAQYTSAEETKLSGIEASADVTDATNVLAGLVGQEAVATGFTGTLDGVLGGGSAAAASVTTLTTSGIALVAAEGGTATTNVSLGLCKAWVRTSGTAVTVSDSFNMTSVTDSGVGLYAPVIANNMNDGAYAVISSGDDKQDGAGIFVHNINDAVAQATTGYATSFKKYAYAMADANQNAASAAYGDLA